MSKRKRNNKTKYLKFISSIICLVCILIYGFIMQNTENTNNVNENISQNQNVTFDLSSILSMSISICKFDSRFAILAFINFNAS